MLYIDNLCEFVRLMIVNEESGIFFPQNSEYTNTSEMVKLIAAAHGRKLKLMRGTTWAVRFMGLFTGLVKKAFGNLTYDTTDRCTWFSLQESIVRTEAND